MVDSVTNSSQQAVINPFQKRVEAREQKEEDKRIQGQNAPSRSDASSDTGKTGDARQAERSKSQDLLAAANQNGASTQRTGASRGSLVDVTV
jgi:hypothetical protein